MGAHTSGNDPADAGNGSFPTWGDYTPGNDPVHAGNGSFLASSWGASCPGNGPLLVAWHSIVTACTVVLGDFTVVLGDSLYDVVCGATCEVLWEVSRDWRSFLLPWPLWHCDEHLRLALTHEQPEHFPLVQLQNKEDSCMRPFTSRRPKNAL